ncbi:MAG: DUF998 domain-containing protein [Micromonosporaceae bacterium]
MGVPACTVRWPRLAAVAAIAAFTVSLGAAAYLHLAAYPQVSPVADTVSSYVHSGGGTALAVSASALAVGFGVLLAGLAAAGLRFDATTRALAAIWGLALLAIAWFPADLPNSTRTLSGLVHNWAGAAVFSCLPLASWRISGALAGAWRRVAGTVRRLAAAAGGAFLGFLVTHPPVNRWYGAGPMHGLGERILLALQLGIVLVLATALLQLTDTDPPSAAVSRAVHPPAAATRARVSDCRAGAAATAARTVVSPQSAPTHCAGAGGKGVAR